jgi:hypothetical protein
MEGMRLAQIDCKEALGKFDPADVLASCINASALIHHLLVKFGSQCFNDFFPISM